MASQLVVVAIFWWAAGPTRSLLSKPPSTDAARFWGDVPFDQDLKFLEVTQI